MQCKCTGSHQKIKQTSLKVQRNQNIHIIMNSHTQIPSYSETSVFINLQLNMTVVRRIKQNTDGSASINTSPYQVQRIKTCTFTHAGLMRCYLKKKQTHYRRVMVLKPYCSGPPNTFRLEVYKADDEHLDLHTDEVFS